MSIQELTNEITIDPLGRGYSGMTDEQVAADMALLNRNAPASLDAIREYVLLEVRTNETLYGRIQIVSESASGSDPLGEGVLTVEHITAAKSMMAILQPGSANIDTNDSRFDSILTDLAGAGSNAIGALDKTAIQALSENKQSRATELGLRARVGDVTRARA